MGNSWVVSYAFFGVTVLASRNIFIGRASGAFSVKDSGPQPLPDVVSSPQPFSSYGSGFEGDGGFLKPQDPSSISPKDASQNDWTTYISEINRSKRVQDTDDDAYVADPDSSAYSFTFTGRYGLYRFLKQPNDGNSSSNVSTSSLPSEAQATGASVMQPKLYNEGSLFSVLLSRQSSIHSVKLVSIQLELEPSNSAQGLERQVLRLSGLGYRDAASLMFHGSAYRPELYLPYVSERTEPSLWASVFKGNRSSPSFGNFPPRVDSRSPNRCVLLGSLRFSTPAEKSRSARPLNLQLPYASDTEWGFDESQFGSGRGHWGDRRQLMDTDHWTNPKIENREPGFPIPSFRTPSPSFASGLSRASSLLKRVVRSLGPGSSGTPPVTIGNTSSSSSSTHDFLADTYQTVPLASPKQDLSGVIISPNCGIRIVISSSEVDLLNLATRVVHFSFFFVFKNLMELHFLLAQMRYTETSTSSPIKVSFISLGLHVAVDCFESIVLLKEAITSNFMASTFVVLTVLKMLFLSIIELRYMVIVLKARYPDPEGVRDMASHFKLHASGTALLLIFTLKLISVAPVSIAILFGFWFPQIVYDIWKGNRRALCLRYIVGMSACRLLFPLYLWGCPSSIFSGEFFKKVPGAPSKSICLTLIGLVGLQVVILVLQRIFGPRYFIPASLLPDSYNYYRVVQKPSDLAKGIEEGGCFECVICMTDISYTGKTLVTTPCDHYFHETCLQQWMEVKLECPTCRGPLPPFV